MLTAGKGRNAHRFGRYSNVRISSCYQACMASTSSFAKHGEEFFTDQPSRVKFRIPGGDPEES